MSIDIMSNMLSSIKNASMVGKPYIEIMHTKDCEAVAKALKEAGFLENVKIFKESGSSFKKLHLDLAYDEMGEPSFTKLERVSKPGRRVYKKAIELDKYMSGFGVRIVSTSRGVITDYEARKKKLGGEVICRVY